MENFITSIFCAVIAFRRIHAYEHTNSNERPHVHSENPCGKVMLNDRGHSMTHFPSIGLCCNCPEGTKFIRSCFRYVNLSFTLEPIY